MLNLCDFQFSDAIFCFAKPEHRRRKRSTGPDGIDDFKPIREHANVRKLFDKKYFRNFSNFWSPMFRIIFVFRFSCIAYFRISFGLNWLVLVNSLTLFSKFLEKIRYVQVEWTEPQVEKSRSKREEDVVGSHSEPEPDVIKMFNDPGWKDQWYMVSDFFSTFFIQTSRISDDCATELQL